MSFNATVCSSESYSLISNVTMCCFGANNIGMTISTVIAHNCPNVNVSVTDFNSSRVLQLGENSFHTHEPNLENMFRKCLNNNLMLTTDLRSAIILADIVLLAVDVPTEKSNNGIVFNTRELEEAARMIAKISESSKIVVQKSIAPVQTFAFLKRILNENKSKHVNFEVLTNPEFFSEGSAINHLLNPDFVLIGRDPCPEAVEAAVTLAAIYSHWVPCERIKIMSNCSVELIRMSINVLLAEKLTCFGTFETICEQSEINISEIRKLFDEINNTIGDCSEPSFSLWGTNLNSDIFNIIHMCQKKKINPSASYWQEIFQQNDYQRMRLRKKILSAFGDSLKNKKFAVFGFSFEDTTKITKDSLAISLSAGILKEGATLSLYGPNVAADQERVLNAIKESGAKNVQSQVKFFQDPYKAAVEVHGIIFNTDSENVKSLDFAAIYKGMTKPAYIFDGKNTLDHDCLTKIGFIVKTIWRK